jgi:hypothetical protein
MNSLPSALTQSLQAFRSLMRAEVFESFCSLLTGLLIGEAKDGTVRASVFAPAAYWPQRLSDLFCRHKLSAQALMAKLAAVALAQLYGHELPERLFWLADGTYHRKALCPADRLAGALSPHQARDGAGQAPQRPLLCLRRPRRLSLIFMKPRAFSSSCTRLSPGMPRGTNFIVSISDDRTGVPGVLHRCERICFALTATLLW